MQIIRTSAIILKQIDNLLDQLKDDEYHEILEVLQGNTIGKHVRHILEFYTAVFDNCNTGTINYDNRAHEKLYETDRKAAKALIEAMLGKLPQLDTEELVKLELSFSETGTEKLLVNSSVARELVYNIEHAIHHLAIIRIAIQSSYPHLQLPEFFGMAYSTVRHVASHG